MTMRIAGEGDKHLISRDVLDAAHEMKKVAIREMTATKSESIYRDLVEVVNAVKELLAEYR